MSTRTFWRLIRLTGVAFVILGVVAFGIAASLIDADFVRALAISWFVSGPCLFIGAHLLAETPA